MIFTSYVRLFYISGTLFTMGIVIPRPNLQPTEPPPVCCPRLPNQHNGSYPPYLEAVSSICNLRARHALVTWDTLNMAFTVHGVNIPVRNEINAKVGMIEYSSSYCYPISAERNLLNE
jgi:hypothetical protein